MLDRIPEDEETPEIETENVIYKVEKIEDKRILSVKACIIRNVVEEEKTKE